jgi:hypothetical protein
VWAWPKTPTDCGRWGRATHNPATAHYPVFAAQRDHAPRHATALPLDSPRPPLARSTAMRIEALALLLIMLLTSCRNDAPEPPAETVTPIAACSAGAEAEDPDSREQPASPEHPSPVEEAESIDEQTGSGPGDSAVDEAAGSQEGPQTSPQPDTAQPPKGSSEATPATAKAGEAQAAGTFPEYPLQDNPLAGCSLCHVDIEDELVGTLHFKEKIGCITCHGPSEGHLADENNEVKPDEVFARADVDRLCERCHECFRPKPEKPELTAEGQRKVCIDCHGPHDCALAADAGPASSP